MMTARSSSRRASVCRALEALAKGSTVFALAFASATALPAAPALAFRPEGHAELELRAYRSLQNNASPDGTNDSGVTVLDGLIDSQTLQCRDQPCTHTKLWARSGGPDASWERQFDTRGQAFHFMATCAEIRAASKLPTLAAAKHAVLDSAYPPNLQFMRLLFDEVVANPWGAFKAGRGIYVLMHAVVDSFSREHTERNPANELVTIKGWALLGACRTKLARQPDGQPSDRYPREMLALLHHGVVGGADWDWVRKSQPETLSKEGENAVAALQDLLVAVHEAQKRAPDAGAAYQMTLWQGGDKQAAARAYSAAWDAVWQRFIAKHFARAGTALPSSAALAQQANLAEVDSFPKFAVGAGAGFSFDGSPAQAFAQLVLAGYFVPYRATFVPGGVAALRMPLSSRGELEPKDKWFRGAVASVGVGVAVQVPWLQWIGAYIGAGMRSDAEPNFGPAFTLTDTLYFRRFVAASMRYEPNVWLTGSNHWAHNLSLNFSFFTRRTRCVPNVPYH